MDSESRKQLENVDMNTAAYGKYGTDTEKIFYFKKGWEARADYKPAYSYGQNLPVSTAVLSKRELVAAMALQGILANPVLWERNDETQIAEMALVYADKLLEKINS